MSDWDAGDVYYQILDEGKVEATLATRAWHVGRFREKLVMRYRDAKPSREIRFITQAEYREVIWPRRAAA